MPKDVFGRQTNVKKAQRAAFREDKVQSKGQGLKKAKKMNKSQQDAYIKETKVQDEKIKKGGMLGLSKGVNKSGKKIPKRAAKKVGKKAVKALAFSQTREAIGEKYSSFTRDGLPKLVEGMGKSTEKKKAETRTSNALRVVRKRNVANKEDFEAKERTATKANRAGLSPKKVSKLSDKGTAKAVKVGNKVYKKELKKATVEKKLGV